ncbi:unnamed protein product [Effrenium voratum]|uniref:Uncharacterized protein n=1 Tax=Effrenium voratum TaxID=2562239 RepID=A0AA36I056_9DINO|nr:unnamed protein product [Effrenium voratum]CAJ1427417.1 unnamed protein product [Effrenium voratum]
MADMADLTLHAVMAFTGKELPPMQVCRHDSLHQLRQKVAEACGVPAALVQLVTESGPIQEQGTIGEALKDGEVQVALTPQGREVITASQDGSARVWHADSGECVFHLTPPSSSGAVHCALLSRCGREAITGSADGTIRRWFLEGGDCVLLEGHSRAVAQLKLAPEGRLLSASDDSTVKLWRLQDGCCLLTLEHPDTFERGVRSVAFSLDARCIVAAGANGLVVQYSESGEIQAKHQGHTAAVNSVVFSPEGKRLLSASDDRTARIWHIASSSCMVLGDPSDGSGPAFAASFSPDGRLAVVAHFARCARLYDMTGSCIHVLQHSDAVLSVDFSPDASLVLTASDDATCGLWRVADGGLLFRLHGHKQGVNIGAFSPDGAQVLSASDDREARLWSVATGACLRVLQGHHKRLNGADFCR